MLMHIVFQFSAALVLGLLLQASLTQILIPVNNKQRSIGFNLQKGSQVRISEQQLCTKPQTTPTPAPSRSSFINSVFMQTLIMRQIKHSLVNMCRVCLQQWTCDVWMCVCLWACDVISDMWVCVCVENRGEHSC